MKNKVHKRDVIRVAVFSILFIVVGILPKVRYADIKKVVVNHCIFCFLQTGQFPPKQLLKKVTFSANLMTRLE